MNLSMKISLSAFVILTSAFASAADNNLRPSMGAEKCVLSKTTQAPGLRAGEILAGVTSINIFGEWQIQQWTNPTNGTFPIRDTFLTFNFKDDRSQAPSVLAVGDEYFKTLQSTTLLTKEGLPLTNNYTGDTIQNVYTHSFESNSSGGSLKLSAVHTVVQYVDHWYSKDVVVKYVKVEKTPVSTYQTQGTFTFKCNAYNDAKDALK